MELKIFRYTATLLSATTSLHAQLSRREFRNPPIQARPSALWTWLNGHVDHKQIILWKQLPGFAFRVRSLNMKFYLSGILLMALASPLLAETIYFNGTDFKGGYVMVPDDLPDDSRKTWVVADIHGAGGLRNESFGHRIKQALEPEKVIFIVPSFSTGYQGGDGEWAKQMIGHFKFVQDRYKTHDRMFVHGHSGGGQFAHRFAMFNPKVVVGVSAHSSGSWACSGGYGEISTRARGIPFAISCGEKDIQLSYAGAPHNRIDWFKLFRDEMRKKDFAVASTIWPGAGHGLSPNLYGPMLKECFLLATQGVMPASDLWHGEAVAEIAKRAQREYGGSSGGGSPATEDQLQGRTGCRSGCRAFPSLRWCGSGIGSSNACAGARPEQRTLPNELPSICRRYSATSPSPLVSNL